MSNNPTPFSYSAGSGISLITDISGNVISVSTSMRMFEYNFLGTILETESLETLKFLYNHLPHVEIQGLKYWHIISNQPTIGEFLNEELFAHINRLVRLHFYIENDKN